MLDNLRFNSVYFNNVRFVNAYMCGCLDRCKAMGGYLMNEEAFRMLALDPIAIRLAIFD
jgi:hypothetical protein